MPQPPNRDSQSGLSGSETIWTFTGLLNVDPESDGDVELGGGWIVKRNEWLLSGRSFYRELLTGKEYEERAGYVHYLVYKCSACPDVSREKTTNAFQNGLVALQIIKPVQSSGFTFLGIQKNDSFRNELAQLRPPMDAGPWARMRTLDRKLLDQVPPMIQKVDRVMHGKCAERKNAAILLQLALEQPHPLFTGLLQ